MHTPFGASSHVILCNAVPDTIQIPVNRAAAWNRAAWLAFGALALVFPSWLVLPSLRFVPGGDSNRAGDYAIATILIALDACAIAMFAQSFRWAHLGMSRRATGFRISDKGVAARLATFGDYSSPWSDVAIEWPEYLFSLELDPAEPLPMRECPTLVSRDGRHVNSDLRRFSAWPEEQWWPAVEKLIRPRLFRDSRWE